VLLRYAKYCFRSINDTINQNYCDKRYDNSIMITIGSNAFCCCRSNTSNRHTCPLHCLTLRCPPVRRGDIKVFAFIVPSSNDECLPVMCESRNFESIFRLSAILHPRWHPRPQLHVSLSHRLRHVTKPTVTYMTDFWFFCDVISRYSNFNSQMQ